MFHSTGVPRKLHSTTRGSPQGHAHKRQSGDACKEKRPGNDRMQRQRERGDPPNDPAPPQGVWECFTQREYPGNYTPPRGAAHKDTHTRDRGGAQASKRSRETNTCSDRGDAGTCPMIQPHHRGYGSVSLSGSTPETTLHHAGQPTRTRLDNPDSNTNCQN